MAIQGGGYGTLEQQQAKAGASFGTIGAKTPSTYNGFQPAQQQSTTGGTTPPQTNTQSGTLTANISNLNPKSPAPPPPIITSDKAKEDLANKQTQLTQIQQDTANHQAGLTKPPEQPLSSKTVEQPTQSSSLEGDLNSLIDNLGTNSAEITNNAQAQITPLQQQQQETQAALDAQAANALGKLNNIAKGTYHLSPAESSLLQSTTDIYKNTIAAQQTANQAYTGQMTEAMASLGISTSAPTQAMGMIHATIDEGNDRVANLNAQMAQSLSTLTLGFQKQDYDMIKSSWDETSGYLNTRLTTLQGMQKSIQDAAEQQKKDISDQTQMAMTAVMDSNTIDYQNKQLLLNQAQLNETTRHDLQTELVAQFTAGMTGLGAGDTGGLPTVIVGANGKPDQASQQQVMDAYTKMYGAQTAGLIKGLTDYTVNPADWRAGSTKGMSRATAVGLAKALDPSYDDSLYGVRASYKKSLTSNTGGSIGSAVNSANKSINHLTAFVDDMGKVGATSSSLLNTALQSTVGQVVPGIRTNLKSASVEGNGVADELAKFFKGTGATDVESISSWKNQLSEHQSPADTHGLVQGAITLLSGQLETLSEQYQNTMGQPPPTNFLGASATANLSRLKNEGYTVNIPGILYTDKDAYLKSDPSAQANMTTAVQQLTAAGLPLTPENILQMAQNQ